MSNKTNKPVAKLPKKLADAFDTYFQTSRFAQKNFVKFDKSMTLGQIKRIAERHGYTLDEAAALSKNFKGTFKISGGKAKRVKHLRVSAATLPFAEDWTGAAK